VTAGEIEEAIRGERGIVMMVLMGPQKVEVCDPLKMEACKSEGKRIVLIEAR
jgi:hypothetical protein